MPGTPTWVVRGSTATIDVRTTTDPVPRVPPYHRAGHRVMPVTMVGMGATARRSLRGRAAGRGPTDGRRGDVPRPARAEGETT
jgi:hypothetical protein